MDEFVSYPTHLYTFMPRGVCVYGARQKLCFEIHKDQIQQFLLLRVEMILHNANYQLHE